MVTTGIVQLVSLILAALALLMGAYLLVIGKRPWRGAEQQRVAPRVRLLGLSYMLVFGSAMIQIVTQPRPSGQLWVSDTRGNGFHLVGTWPESMASSWVDIPTHFVWMPQGQKISFVHRNALYVVQTE